MFNFSRETLWKSKMNFDAIYADFSVKRHTAKKHNHRKRYCRHYGKRLRELICTKQCPFFALLKPRKDGHIWKTFTELDLLIFLENGSN